jgi:hypothetical protein
MIRKIKSPFKVIITGSSQPIENTEKVSGSATMSEKLLDLHKPWTYTMKRLGSLEFCSECNDSTGRPFVAYPCKTVRIIKGHNV